MSRRRPRDDRADSGARSLVSRALRRGLLVAALALSPPALAGCGQLSSAGPRAAATPAATSTARAAAGRAPAREPAARLAPAIARAERTHELPTPAPAQRVRGGWRTPADAVRSFALAYVNWTAPTVVARLRALAAASVGAARAEMTTEAGEVAHDHELHAGGVTNSGTVEAVAPLPATAGAGRWVVVTRERTGALDTDAYRGLAAAWHVSVATVTRTPGGLWTLSAWQPES